MNKHAINACKRAQQLHPHHSVVLYGSHAQGDYTSKSDVDVLLVGPGQFKRWNEGSISYSQYPSPFLSYLAESGSLFALHLKRDGIVMADPGNLFQDTIAKFNSPSSYDHLLNELKVLANALDVDSEQYSQAHAWLNRVALYLMRTAVFAELAIAGQPCFSVPQISRRSGDKDLAQNFQIKYHSNVGFDEFSRLRRYVETKLGITAKNDFGSLVRFVLNVSPNSDLVRAFGRKIVALSDHPEISNCIVDYAVRCIPRKAKAS